MEQIAYIGKDSIDKLTETLIECSAKTVLLLRGGNSYISSGASSIVEEALLAAGCSKSEYFDFTENPKIEDVDRGIEILNSSSFDLILAVGGGSVIDMSKLVRFFYSYQGDKVGSTFNKIKPMIPLIAIPTTAGTGAEATRFAVMYKDGVKYSVEHSDILPDYAIIYPPFTYKNPKYLTACTGFDALSQAIEAYWNVNATEESDKYAIKAIEMLYENLPKVVNAPTEALRDTVSEGSYWAGRAINITKTTAPHAFSYPFTTYYGYPHGHAVALTFAFFMKYNYGDNNLLTNHKVKMNYLYKMLGIENVDKAKGIITKYISNIGLESRDNNIDINLIINNVNLERLENNPIKISARTINEIWL